MTDTTLKPESVRLARAAWDTATPGSRVLFLHRNRYAARLDVPAADMGLPFLPWEELPPETCEALAWDVQFMRRVLADGFATLKAATVSMGGSGMGAGA